MERNWAELGIAWSEEVVRKNDGGTKVELNGKAQIPLMADVDLVIAHFGKDYIPGMADSTSWRVEAQDVNRTRFKKGWHGTAEEMRELVYQRLRGIRAASSPQVKTITETKTEYALPDGTTYAGDSLVEYQQAFVAAMHDCGVANEIAIAMAQKLQLKSK